MSDPQACAELDEQQCTDRSIDSAAEDDLTCHPIKGRAACDDGPAEFIVCADGGDGDATLETCARDPETDASYIFPTTEVPSGWTTFACDDATDSCGAGGGGGMN